jgi:hypothetical protein
MTVRRLLEEIDSRELSEWEAFDQEIEPIGDQRLDVLAGQIVSAIYNVNRKPDAEPFTPGRCMIKWRDPEPDPEPQAKEEDEEAARQALAAEIKAGMLAFVKKQNP